MMTSIERLEEQILNNDMGVVPLFVYAFLEEAKEIHKEETMDAFQAGKWDWSEHSNNGKHSMDPAEYYNKTFKKD
jgi:hypothetical protein